MAVYALNWLKSFIKIDKGVTAIEYGLIAALISVAIIAALLLVGDELKATYNAISTAIAGANS